MAKAEERNLRQEDAEEPTGQRCCMGCERDFPAEGNAEGLPVESHLVVSVISR